MTNNYEDYIQHVDDDIETCLDSMGCQPILFVGSGFSRRYMDAPNWEELLMAMADICPYMDAPNWEELLMAMADICPYIVKDYAYYKQSYGNEIDIGTSFIEPFKEWAWENQELFESGLFTTEFDSDIYLKYKVAEHLNSITPVNPMEGDADLIRELSSLKAINPHAIITTNYDTLLQKVFTEYSPIIGQKILRYNTFSIGEIFKIHGCVSSPNSLILARKDYDEFHQKKKYLSAKLLTFFAEHPLLFIGYSATDPNIISILSDIDEIISEDSELIPNIYILQWKRSFSTSDYPLRDTSISLGDGRSIRVKCIIASDFDWVFKAFSNNNPIESIHPKILRSLLARTYDMVRCDIPRRTIEVDFETLEQAVSTKGEFGKLIGITSTSDPAQVNAQFPYSLTQVGHKLGYSSWHPANELIIKITKEKGVNIKESDNQYHISIKSGIVLQTRKYSQLLVDLFERVRDDEEYEVTL